MKLFITGFMLALSLCLDIGIVNVAIIKTAIDRGFRRSFYVGLGSTAGDLIYASLSILGIGMLLAIKWFRMTLWIGGTLVLLMLCAHIIIQLVRKNSAGIDEMDNLTQAGKRNNYFIYGMILALSSPSAIIWYISAGGSMIATVPMHSRFDYIDFLGGFGCASLMWGVIISWISYKSASLFSSRVRSILSIISAMLFLILAIIIFIKGFHTMF